MQKRNEQRDGTDSLLSTVGRTVKRSYTLVEILITMAIILILLALLMPTWKGARERAEYARWLAYNAMLSRDSYCVINYNFEDGASTRLNSSADACEDDNFNSTNYNGKVEGTGTWSRDGRWPVSKFALQFNGSDTLVKVPGLESVDFDGSTGFTVMAWMRFDNMNSIHGLWSKAKKVDGSKYSQYEVYACDKQIAASVFNDTLTVDCPDITSGKWLHVALKYEPNSQEVAVANQVPQLACDGGGIGSFGKGGNGNGNGNGDDDDDDDDDDCGDDDDDDDDDDAGDDDDDDDDDDNDCGDDDDDDDNPPGDDDDDDDEPEEPQTSGNGTISLFVAGKKVGEKQTTLTAGEVTANSNLIIGALAGLDGDSATAQNHFFGFMDEFVAIKRALPDYDITGHYDMGLKR